MCLLLHIPEAILDAKKVASSRINAIFPPTSLPRKMYLIAIAWLYVTVMMAVVEATSSQGTLLGAFFTLLLYGILPLTIVLFIVGTPSRKRAARRKQLEEQGAQESTSRDPDTAQER